MTKSITLIARINCDKIEDLTDGQRRCLVEYKNQDKCRAEFYSEREEYNNAQMRMYGHIEHDPFYEGFLKLREPHAILEVTIKGTSLVFSPYDVGVTLQVDDDSKNTIVDGLGTDAEWIMTRYGSKNTYTIVSGLL